MKVMKAAQAGTLESGDALVMVEPAGEFTIDIDSPVYLQFGKQMEQSVAGLLQELQVAPCHLTIRDKGALDYVLRARVETALLRAAEGVIS